MSERTLFKIVLMTITTTCWMGFSGCENREKPPTEEREETPRNEDYYEYQELSLADHDIPAVIWLPDETADIGTATKPEVKHTEADIKWEITVGQNFQLLIEDYGDNVDLVEVEKKELADQKFFKVNYLIDEKDLILYERILLVSGSEKASPAVGVEHRTYHVYAQKTIDDITYELQSKEDGYGKEIIEKMAKSIRSFKGIAENS